MGLKILDVDTNGNKLKANINGFPNEDEPKYFKGEQHMYRYTKFHEQLMNHTDDSHLTSCRIPLWHLL